MTDREAMKMALAKLEHLWEIGIDAEFKVELMPEIEALRQSLAQPEQEPFKPDWVSYRQGLEDGAAQPEPKSISTNDHLCAMLRQVHDVLACTALPMKRKWVGLTNDEINDFSAGCHLGKSVQTAIYQAAAKLKEKNNG